MAWLGWMPTALKEQRQAWSAAVESPLVCTEDAGCISVVWSSSGAEIGSQAETAAIFPELFSSSISSILNHEGFPKYPPHKWSQMPAYLLKASAWSQHVWMHTGWGGTEWMRLAENGDERRNKTPLGLFQAK